MKQTVGDLNGLLKTCKIVDAASAEATTKINSSDPIIPAKSTATDATKDPVVPNSATATEGNTDVMENPVIVIVLLETTKFRLMFLIVLSSFILFTEEEGTVEKKINNME
jgi:hypothetical protein